MNSPSRAKNIRLAFGVSQKRDGAMSLNNLNAKNRLAFLRYNSIPVKQLVGLKLNHSSKIAEAKYKDRGKLLKNYDALITNKPQFFLTLTVADCFPVFFYDRKKQAIGLVHSGWRGTLKSISGKTVQALVKKFNSKPGNLLVHIGPGIRNCHFEVKRDVFRLFMQYPQAKIRRANKLFIDLPKIIKQQLLRAGVKRRNIIDSKQCTFCETKKYFSFRRDRPKQIQAMLAFIGLVQ